MIVFGGTLLKLAIQALITVFKNLKVDSFTLTERIQIILPVQLSPSPSYPGLQEQLNDPWVLLHQAFS